METKETNNSKGDYIIVHKGHGYLHLPIEDIWCVRVDRPFPFSTDVVVLLETPFGKLELEGFQAKHALRKISRKLPNVSLD